MSTIFAARADMATRLAGLSLLTQLPPYAKAMNGTGHPHGVIVGDQVVLLSELDWNL
jgi:hypothetical protein